METGSEAPIWDPKNTPRESLFIWCTSVRNSSDGDGLVGSDCVNATLVRGDNKASDKMIVNLSTLLTLSSNPVTSRRLPHNAGNLVPVESELMIYNRSLLKVNIEVVPADYFFFKLSVTLKIRQKFANLHARAKFAPHIDHYVVNAGELLQNFRPIISDCMQIKMELVE